MKFEESYLAYIVKNTQNTTNYGYKTEANSDEKTLKNIADLYIEPCWTKVYSNEYKLESFEGVSGTYAILDFLGLNVEDFKNIDEKYREDMDKEAKKKENS